MRRVCKVSRNTPNSASEPEQIVAMIAQLRPRELQDWLSSLPPTAKPVLLDVREPHEVAHASVRSAPGFTVLTIPMSSVPLRLAELDPAQPIACLCHHGGRSMQVANFLLGRGYTHLLNVTGGIHAWAAELDNAIPTY